uniref:Uncharacterized protein n=1 Tax=Oncorhynchus tshawytscha TaxID=74940 RepID=A0A8C8HHJ3_ONCTS
MRHQQLSSDRSPGPAYLVPSNITRIGHDGAPSYSLYSRPNDPQLFQTPGPDGQFPRGPAEGRSDMSNTDSSKWKSYLSSLLKMNRLS